MERSLAWGLVAVGVLFLLFASVGLGAAELGGSLLTGLFGLAFVVAGAHGLTKVREEPPEVVPRVRPVPAEAAEVNLDALPRPFHACARCGYLGAHPRKLDEGGLPGVAEMQGIYACDRCGHQGLPVAFDAPDEYRAFLRGLAAQS